MSENTENTSSVPPFCFKLNLEKMLYALLIFAALVTRFYGLGDRVMSHDESLHAKYSWELLTKGDYVHNPMMHGPLKFEITAFVYWIFGDSDLTSRVPSAILGVLAVFLMYFFRKYIGRTGALVSAFLMLISPYMLYYSRYIRDEMYVIVWGMALVLCIIKYFEYRSSKYIYLLTAVSAFFYATMETSFIYIAIMMLFLGFFLAYDVLFSAQWPYRKYFLPFCFSFILTLGSVILLLACFSVMKGITFAAMITMTGLVLSLGFLLLGFKGEIRRFPAFDLLIVFGAFVLPQLASLPVRMLGLKPFINVMGVYTKTEITATLMIALFLFLLSLVIGFIWGRRKFAVSAGIFYGIYLLLFTTFFKNGWGVISGFIGSLGYWTAQHGFHRGGQPWFYYPLIQFSLYEYLPVCGALFAFLTGMISLRKNIRIGSESKNGITALDFPVLAFFGFWAVMSLLSFTIASERMPWLTTHITLPLILLSGWAIGRFIDGIDWQLIYAKAWPVFLLVPVFLIAAVAILDSAIYLLHGKIDLFAFFSALAVSIAAGYCILYLGNNYGYKVLGRASVLLFFVLLSLLTIHTSFRAAYVNYDYANEFLVYAHGTRGVKTAVDGIETLSLRTKDGPGISVAYDTIVAWPMAWYLRDYKNQLYYENSPSVALLDNIVVLAGNGNWSKVEPILGDRYNKYEYIRLVWPMQDYFKLSLKRAAAVLLNEDYRYALWDIWFSRDYTRYGKLTDQNFDLAQWPVSDRFRMYIRKDAESAI